MATSKQYTLLFELAAKLGPNFSQSFKTAEKTTDALKGSIDSTNKIVRDVSAYQQQAAALEKSSARVSELWEEHERLTTEIAETEKATPKLTKKLEENEKAIRKAEDAEEKDRKKLEELKETMQKAGVSTDKLGKDTEELKQEYEKLRDSQEKSKTAIEELTEKQEANSKSLSKAKKYLAGLIGVVIGLGTAFYAGPVKSAQEFQTAMAKVGTIADTNVVPLADLRKEIVALSNETGKSADELAESVYSAISAGQGTADAVAFTANATRLATAGFADTGQAIDILTTVLNSYGMEADRAADISDMLINTQNRGKTTVGELASSMGKIIPTANANNVALEQVCAGYEKLTANGIATAEATTYMNSMLNELGKTGSKTDKLLREKTGKSFKELMAEGYSLADVLQLVQDGAESGGLSLSDMFGSAEAGKAALTLMSQGADLFNESVQGMIESCGATEAAYAKMMDTTEAKVARAKTSIANLGITLGDMVLPYVSMAAEKVAELTGKFSEFAQNNPQVIATVAKLAAALVGLKAGGLAAKAGILQISSGIKSVQKVFMTIKSLGITKYLKEIGGGFGGILAKVAPIVGVIAAVGGAIYYVSTHLQEVRGFIKKIFGDEGVVIFNKLWNTITQIGTAIKNAFFKNGTGMLDVLKNILPDILNILQAGLLPVLPQIASLFGQIAQLVGEFVAAVLPLFGDLMSAAVAVLSVLIAEILPVAIKFISGILVMVLQVVQQVLPVFIQLVSTAVSILTQIIQAVLPSLTGLIQTLLPIVGQIIETVMPTLINLLNTVVPIFMDIIQAVLPVLQQLLQALIPVIQVVAEVFSGTLGAALQTISNIIGSVMKVLQGLIDFVTGVFTGNWSKAWEGVKNIFGGIFEGLGEIFKAPFRFIVSIINGVIRGLNKLKVPDWVPGIGGKGINIPEIPEFAKGTNRTPSTFIAGENGPELITDAAGRKVFTAAQTGQIFNNMAQAGNLNAANNVNVAAGGTGTIIIQVTNSPSVTVAGGEDTGSIKAQLQQYDEEFLEKLREIIRTILKEQREQEVRVTYA